jgi:hypothetical protein
MGSICRWPVRPLRILSIAKIVGRMISTPTFFTTVSTAGIDVTNISRFGRLGKWILLVMKQEVLILIQHGT